MPRRRTTRERHTRPQPARRRPLTEAEAQAAISAESLRLQSETAVLPIIKVVGMSGAGKSTLVRALCAEGYNARAVSQEHSGIPNLWQQFEKPLVLIYLTLDLAAQRTRRSDVSWTPEYYELEAARLASARAHADLRIDTTHLSATAVREIALSWLQEAGIRRSPTPLQPPPSTGSASRRGADTPTDSQT